MGLPSQPGPAVVSDPRATKTSPWHDNVRHQYEAGRNLETLAEWYGVSRRTLAKWIVAAGGIIRPRQINLRRGPPAA